MGCVYIYIYFYMEVYVEVLSPKYIPGISARSVKVLKLYVSRNIKV